MQNHINKHTSSYTLKLKKKNVFAKTNAQREKTLIQKIEMVKVGLYFKLTHQSTILDFSISTKILKSLMNITSISQCNLPRGF